MSFRAAGVNFREVILFVCSVKFKLVLKEYDLVFWHIFRFQYNLIPLVVGYSMQQTGENWEGNTCLFPFSGLV